MKMKAEKKKNSKKEGNKGKTTSLLRERQAHSFCDVTAV